MPRKMESLKVIERSHDHILGQFRESHRGEASIERHATLIERAFSFAGKAHSQQFRKDGSPYFLHPLAVAEKVVGARGSAEEVCASLLHDVREDQGVTEREIVSIFGSETGFGKEVAEIVNALSKPIFDPRTKKLIRSGDPRYPEFARLKREGKLILPKRVDEAGIKKRVNAAFYQQLYRSMERGHSAILVKLSDVLHNVRTLDAVSEDHAGRALSSFVEFMDALSSNRGFFRRFRTKMSDEVIGSLAEGLKREGPASQLSKGVFILPHVQSANDSGEVASWFLKLFPQLREEEHVALHPAPVEGGFQLSIPASVDFRRAERAFISLRDSPHIRIIGLPRHPRPGDLEAMKSHWLGRYVIPFQAMHPSDRYGALFKTVRGVELELVRRFDGL